ncbi:MAG: L,D-transpeptidase family protein [Sulfurovaceae bacterium]|nr:L,D-transpeptidase family protein [Sulfurovaceae bacterium]
MRFKYLILIFLLMNTTLVASKKIVINLSTQRAYAMKNNKVIFSGRISSGTPNRATPRGSFKILEKKRRHYSNLWPKKANGKQGGAPMPYMMRLTYTGYALHQGYVPNYPASHGCVRLQKSFAKKMFRWAKVGTKVKIVGHTPSKRYSSKKKKKRKLKRYSKKRDKAKRKIKRKKISKRSKRKLKRYSKKRYKAKRQRYKKVKRYKKRKSNKRKHYVKIQKKYKKRKKNRRSKNKRSKKG